VRSGESLTRPKTQKPKNRRVSEMRNSALPGCSAVKSRWRWELTGRVLRSMHSCRINRAHVGGKSQSVQLGGLTGGTQEPIGVERRRRGLFDRALALMVRSACTGNRLIFSSLGYVARQRPTHLSWRLSTEVVRFSLLNIYTRMAELQASFPGRFAPEGFVYERVLKLSQAQDERALLYRGFLLSFELQDILGPSYRLLEALAATAGLIGVGGCTGGDPCGPEDASTLEDPETPKIEIVLPPAGVRHATHLSRRLLHEIVAAHASARAAAPSQEILESLAPGGGSPCAAEENAQPRADSGAVAETSRTKVGGQVVVHEDEVLIGKVRFSRRPTSGLYANHWLEGESGNVHGMEERLKPGTQYQYGFSIAREPRARASTEPFQETEELKKTESTEVFLEVSCDLMKSLFVRRRVTYWRGYGLLPEYFDLQTRAGEFDLTISLVYLNRCIYRRVWPLHIGQVETPALKVDVELPSTLGSSQTGTS
jgi:hypothetical protein